MCWPSWSMSRRKPPDGNADRHRGLSVRPSTFGSLRLRNFRLFFGGQLISQIGNWLTMITQTLLVLHLTDNGFAIGLLAACQFGPVLVIGAWTGLVADRADKRRLLIVVQTWRWCSPSCWRPSPSAATRPCWPSTPWPSSAALRGVRQPGPAGLRRGDGAGGPRPERGQPQQRPDDQLAGRRPGARPAC